MLSVLEKVVILRQFHFFSFLEGNDLAKISQLFDEVEVESSQSILEADNHEPVFIIVLFGECSGQKADEHSQEGLQLYGAYHALGLSKTTPQLQSLSTCRYLRLSWFDFEELLQQEAQVCYGVLKAVLSLIEQQS